MPTLGGGFMAMRHETLKRAGAFDEGMPQWGSEDLELCVRYWLLGYEVWVVPEVTVLHYFRNARPYGVQLASAHPQPVAGGPAALQPASASPA